ncbi:MAG TPA: hypothetical protein VE267_12640, partial [Bradyrhizobium sp.]|nr:hypothetical protein [Bradyrhizobium sp.]
MLKLLLCAAIPVGYLIAGEFESGRSEIQSAPSPASRIPIPGHLEPDVELPHFLKQRRTRDPKELGCLL